MAVESIKQLIPWYFWNMRSIKKTNSSVSGSKEPSLESQTNISASGLIAGSNKQTNILPQDKDILNEEETLLPLGSQVMQGLTSRQYFCLRSKDILNETNILLRRNTTTLESQLQDIELGSKKSESESSSESGSSTESGSESGILSLVILDQPARYLQGASRTVGGFSRGHAAGNTYNYGDEEEDPFITAPDTKGDIRLFFKSDTTDPDFVIMDQQPSSDFYDILETLGNIYSPVAKQNSQISIRENGYWSLKGYFSLIYYKLKFYKDGANIEQKSESTGLMVSKPSGSSSKLLGSSESPEDIAKAMIISHFNIPECLFKKSSKEQDIHATYEKYEIIENIWNNHQPDLSAIGAASKSKVDKKQIISLLIAPSTYYSYASNVFPLLHYYPEMMSWMKREEDIDTNKVWKSKKANFINLLSILEGKRDAIENESQRREVESEEDPESEEEVVRKNKGKGKQREDKGNKGKSKDDKEGKEKSKRSHRKDKGKSKQL
ncbi:hypothetical protein BDQ17DRAFT_1336869 [Cyathus striatus]|nr:hypothetical protein BDQ17DRAFT_1336869 [Cyathus striatus]